MEAHGYRRLIVALPPSITISFLGDFFLAPMRLLPPCEEQHHAGEPYRELKELSDIQPARRSPTFSNGASSSAKGLP